MFKKSTMNIIIAILIAVALVLIANKLYVNYESKKQSSSSSSSSSSSEYYRGDLNPFGSVGDEWKPWMHQTQKAPEYYRFMDNEMATNLADDFIPVFQDQVKENFMVLHNRERTVA